MLYGKLSYNLHLYSIFVEARRKLLTSLSGVAKDVTQTMEAMCPAACGEIKDK